MTDNNIKKTDLLDKSERINATTKHFSKHEESDRTSFQDDKESDLAKRMMKSEGYTIRYFKTGGKEISEEEYKALTGKRPWQDATDNKKQERSVSQPLMNPNSGPDLTQDQQNYLRLEEAKLENSVINRYTS